MARGDGGLEHLPSGVQLGRQQFLDLVHTNLQALPHLHEQRHLLQDQLAFFNLLILVLPVGLLLALHALKHDVDGHAVDCRQRGTAAIVHLLLALLHVEFIDLLLRGRLQVAEQHAQHHRVTEDVLLALLALLLLFLGGHLVVANAPEPLEEPIVGIDAAAAEAGVGN